MNNSPLPAIGVLISGGGTNLQALIDQCQQGFIPGYIAIVISDQPEAYGLQRAQQNNIPTVIVQRKQFADRDSFDAHMMAILDSYQVRLVALAGFMRLLSDHFVRHYAGRLINIHPSLLPAFPGLHVQKKAIAAGVRFSGATVHFVTETMDAGPIIIQAVVPILPDDTPEQLAARILKQEHRIYPLAVRLFLENKIILAHGRVQINSAAAEAEAAILNPAPVV